MSFVFTVPRSIKSILIIDALLYAFGLVGIYLLSIKGDLPFYVDYTDSGIRITAAKNLSAPSLTGKIITKINGYTFDSPEETETYLDGFKAGDEVVLTFTDNTQAKISLENYYSFFYCFLAWLIGTSFFLISIVVLIKSRAEKPARIFNWVCVLTAIFIMATWGAYNISPYQLGYLTRSVLHLSVSLMPILFIHFTLVFPKEKHFNTKIIFYVLYAFSVLVFALLSYNFIKLISQTSLENVKSYVLAYNISRIFLIVCVLAAITIFVYSFKTSKSDADRKKLKWILFGLSVGPLSFILLWTLPLILIQKSLVREEIILIISSIIPITFAISIVKYHMMDIDLIINRSFVYSIVIGLLLVIYTLSFGLITNYAFPDEAKFSAITAAVLIVLLFQPVRNRIQKFVDKKFFRLSYDFRLAVKKFFEEIEQTYDIQSLTVKVVNGTYELLPVEKIGLFLLDKNDHLKLSAHKNFDLLKGRSLKFQRDNLKTDLSLPVALPGKVENGVQTEIADVKVFERWGIDLVMPIKSSEKVIHGFLVLGAKKSGSKFTIEDIDLLKAFVRHIAVSIDRIKLQEELILKRVEAEKLEELNKLKSYFVSSVSHDMKTPLTSIKMFAEILQSSKEINSEKSREYLQMIEGESNRLARLIDNVLDFSKIERGMKEYHLEFVSLNDIIKQTMDIMQYQFKLHKFTVKMNLAEEEKLIYADKDAVEEALINLLSNSIKYSIENKFIRVSTALENDYMNLIVEDQGIGISEDNIDKIFNPFFRVESKQMQNSGGAGLGLSIVKHIMDAHHGKIEVKSEVGKGSKFILLFPIKNSKTI